MADFTLACDSVVIVNPPVPFFKIVTPVPSFIPMTLPDVSVIVQNPPRLVARVSRPSTTNIVLPVAGPAGPPGPTELFDSLTPPTTALDVYLRFERDLDGDVQAIYLGTAT